jgi:hypothetical protein
MVAEIQTQQVANMFFLDSESQMCAGSGFGRRIWPLHEAQFSRQTVVAA